jgi:ribosome biogenesis GTPase A
LQILCGLYPIAQVREPYSSIGFLHRRLRVDQIYSLKFPYDLDEDEKFIEEKNHKWSAWELCESYADLRGYRTNKGGKLDIYRAGKEILKETVNGVIRLYFSPPDPIQEEEEEKNGLRENILHAAERSHLIWNSLVENRDKQIDILQDDDENDDEEEGDYDDEEE